MGRATPARRQTDDAGCVTVMSERASSFVSFPPVVRTSCEHASPAAMPPCLLSRPAGPRHSAPTVRHCTRGRHGVHRPGVHSAVSDSTTPALDACVFTIIVDDIVHPDGRTTMAAMGGGGPQTAWGLRLHPRNASVALAAGVNTHDLPPSCTHWLASNGVDTSGLVALPDGVPTPRAWQVCEADGKRTQVWRTPHEDDTLRPPPSLLPSTLRGAASFHVGIHPNRRGHLEYVGQLRLGGRGGGNSPSAVVSLEPYTAADFALVRAHQGKRGHAVS
jgi:hypothetical protein